MVRIVKIWIFWGLLCNSLYGVQNDEVFIDANTARKIAKLELSRRYGYGTLSAPIVGYDIDGTVNSYMFIMKLGALTFPADSMILKEIRMAKDSIYYYRKLLTKANENFFDSLKDTPKSILIPSSIRYFRNKLIHFIKTRWGAEKYATIVISAKKDRAPVLTFSKHLPFYYTYRDKLIELATKYLGNSNMHLSRFYFDWVLDEIFEFEDSFGERVWVRMFPIRIININELKSKRFVPTEREKQWILKKWEEELTDIRINNIRKMNAHFVAGRTDAIPAF